MSPNWKPWQPTVEEMWDARWERFRTYMIVQLGHRYLLNKPRWWR